jgi:hypothetical protein
LRARADLYAMLTARLNLNASRRIFHVTNIKVLVGCFHSLAFFSSSFFSSLLFLPREIKATNDQGTTVILLNIK